jgi:hypothetical protein
MNPKPAQVTEQLSDVRLLGPIGIRILDPQQQAPAMVAGEQQIE